MSSILDDLRVVLHKAQERDRRTDIGLGRNEIHPLAYHLKRETNGELFGDAEFNSGYRGVRSPDIRKILSFFEEGKDKKILKKGQGVDIKHSDEYFQLHYEEDQEAAQNHLDTLGSEIEQTIEEALASLDEDWLEFVNEQNKLMQSEVSSKLVCH